MYGRLAVNHFPAASMAATVAFYINKCGFVTNPSNKCSRQVSPQRVMTFLLKFSIFEKQIPVIVGQLHPVK
jgi:hypothetical protein